MALGIYDRFFGYIEGALLGESSSIEIKYDGAPTPVQTMVKDLAGCTPVPKMCTISVKSFVPSAGFEFDAVKSWLATQFIDIKVQAGGSGKAVKTTGWVNPPSISSGIGPTEINFDVVCEAKLFE